MRLRKPIVAVTAAAFFTLAACGGSGDGSSGPPGVTNSLGDSGGAGAGQDPNRQAPAAPIEGAQTGGIVNVVSQLGLNTMDPTDAYYLNTGSILSGLITRSLTQYAYDPKSKDMVLIPDLATDLGTPNDDFTSWTFTLRDGVKWENGDPVTPEDLKYGAERAFDRTTFPDGPTYNNDYMVDGDTYEGPYKSGTDYKGIVINGMKITYKMDKPFPDFPYWGAFAAMGPIPTDKAINDPTKYQLHPWSTGPYMFKPDGYTPEKSLVLVKNPYWDANTDPGRHQYVDGYNMKFDVPSAKIDQLMIQDSGDGQSTLSIDNILSTDYVKFTQDSADRLVTGTLPCTAIWFPDYRKIKDVNVRRAIGYAYPYHDAWAAAGLIENVTRVPASNIMPPGISGRTEYNALDVDPGVTDTAKAKQLLTDANALGFELKFPYRTDDPLAVAAKDAIVASLEKAGFKATPVATTTADNSSLIAEADADLNIRGVGWCSDWPSGSTWFPPLFESTDLAKEGVGTNYSVFSEKAVDDKIQSILAMDLKDQPAAWNALDKEIQDKYYAVVPTGYYGAAMMRGSKVNGMFDDRTSGLPTWKDIWLTQ